jgi:hypothetical protein
MEKVYQLRQSIYRYNIHPYFLNVRIQTLLKRYKFGKSFRPTLAKAPVRIQQGYSVRVVDK